VVRNIQVRTANNHLNILITYCELHIHDLGESAVRGPEKEILVPCPGIEPG